MRICRLISSSYRPFSTARTQYLASLDQSTTGTKFSIYLPDGTLLDQSIVPHTQISQKEGWLEHNPSEIYDNVQKSIQIVMERLDGKIGLKPSQIAGLGISNQRQTVVCWDENGNPLHNALVWCDTRTEQVCKDFASKYGTFAHKTGLPISTYFSMFKIIWLLDNVEGLREKVKAGKARFGTIDSWVAYKLTGEYVTDCSNASRTYLCDITTGNWDPELLTAATLREHHLPRIVKSFEKIGSIQSGALKGVPISCILGDQQASAYAHNLGADEMKITYGTGCFLLGKMGNKPTFDPSFVTTILNKNNLDQLSYGYEVSVECGGGTLNWANRMGLFQNYNDLNDLPESQQGLYFFPSFGSIFSPFWKNNVHGGVIGMGYNTTNAHMLKAILDSITFRLYDNIKGPQFQQVKKIIVDGGMSKNPKFMQMQADLFKKEIEVRTLDTCWGVAKGVLAASNTPVAEGSFETHNYLPTSAGQKELELYEKWCLERKKFYHWD